MSYCRFQLYRKLLMALSVAFISTAAVQADQRKDNPWKELAGPGANALANASDQSRFTFVLFWRDENSATQQMQSTLHQATEQMKTGVNRLSVRVTDPRDAELVKRFGVDRAPLPLIASVAPNGAVTKAWPLKASPEQLREGLVSPATAGCLKAMQEQKLSLVCVYNAASNHGSSLQQAATAFQADKRFGPVTEVINIDPADKREQAFLTSLKVNTNSSDAVAVLLSPAGQPLGTFVGPVAASHFVAKIEAAQQSCCPDGKCGPEGCCPGGQCTPQQK